MVNTFLPYPDATKSARTLDTKRLGKQIMEVGQIMRAHADPAYGWQNHPATRMWRGHTGWLYMYANACASAWKRLPNTKSTHGAWTRIQSEFGPSHPHPDWHELIERTQTLPRWWGDPQFHLSHQSNLVRKDPDHYRPYFPDVPDDLPYVWPEP